MKAILNSATRAHLSYKLDNELLNMKDRLLYFVRTGKVNNTNIGLCANLRITGITESVTGTPYPIRGHAWENNVHAYWDTLSGGRAGEKYKGHQLKQRRKLAIKLINVIDQYMKETP